MIFAAATMLLLGTQAKAQVSVGGGFVNTSFSGPDAGIWSDVSLPGFYFGASYNIAFSALEGLTFEPGVYFQHFGKTAEFGGFKLENLSFRANYISVPLNLQYALVDTNDIGLGLYTGPRFNFGFIGNAFDKTRLGFKNVDAQWGVGAALTIAQAVQVRLGYDFGLDKAVKDAEWGSNLKVRRNALHVGVAFVL